MRNRIIILSIVFFVLSGYIKFKESDISAALPSHNDLNEVKSKGVSPEVEEALRKMAREQAANQAMVKNLQAMVANLEDRLANEKKAPREYTEPRGSKKGVRVLAVLGEGVFDTGQIVISKDLMKTVNEIAPEIMSFPEYDLVIEGHTDNIPIRSTSEEGYRDNMELSFLRAKAVALILAENGIPFERISVISYGETRPIASNETVEGRARNRRVEIKLVPAEAEF